MPPLRYVSPLLYSLFFVHSCHVRTWDYLLGDGGGGRHFKNPEVPTYLGKPGSVEGEQTLGCHFVVYLCRKFGCRLWGREVAEVGA